MQKEETVNHQIATPPQEGIGVRLYVKENENASYPSDIIMTEDMFDASLDRLYHESLAPGDKLYIRVSRDGTATIGVVHTGADSDVVVAYSTTNCLAFGNLNPGRCQQKMVDVILLYGDQLENQPDIIALVNGDRDVARRFLKSHGTRLGRNADPFAVIEEIELEFPRR